MTRIGIFEGSFDPPHKGHVAAARAFMEQMWLDFLYVIVLPTEGESTEDTAHRQRMCELAFAGIDGVYVSDVALKNEQFSTVDAMRELCAEERRLFLLCGTDRMLSLGDEDSAEEIFRYSYPVYIRREKDALLDQKIIKKIEKYRDDYGKVMRRIVAEPIELSSERIRMRLSRGESIAGLVSDVVEKYIGDNHLYV